MGKHYSKEYVIACVRRAYQSVEGGLTSRDYTRWAEKQDYVVPSRGVFDNFGGFVQIKREAGVTSRYDSWKDNICVECPREEFECDRDKEKCREKAKETGYYGGE